MTQTDDPEQATAETAGAMSAHRLFLPRRDSFGALLHAATVGTSTLVYLAYRSAVEIRATAPIDYYALHVVLSGGFEVTTDTGRASIATGRGCVLSPGEELRLRFSPSTVQIAAKIPIHTIERGLGQIGERAEADHVRFALSSACDCAWASALRTSIDTLDRCDSGLINPLLGEEVERMLLTSLLLSQPHSASAAIHHGGSARGYRAAGRAAEALRSHPERPLDLADLALRADVSVRTLQEGFQHRYGRTPTSYLREVRLDQAHRMLGGATRSSASVTEVATVCGFTHLGRFAHYYRTRFGRSPSTTLALPG